LAPLFSSFLLPRNIDIAASGCPSKVSELVSSPFSLPLFGLKGEGWAVPSPFLPGPPPSPTILDAFRISFLFSPRIGSGRTISSFDGTFRRGRNPFFFFTAKEAGVPFQSHCSARRRLLFFFLFFRDGWKIILGNFCS